MSAATTPHPATVFDVDVDPEFKAMLDFRKYRIGLPRKLLLHYC